MSAGERSERDRDHHAGRRVGSHDELARAAEERVGHERKNASVEPEDGLEARERRVGHADGNGDGRHRKAGDEIVAEIAAPVGEQRSKPGRKAFQPVASHGFDPAPKSLRVTSVRASIRAEWRSGRRPPRSESGTGDRERRPPDPPDPDRRRLGRRHQGRRAVPSRSAWRATRLRRVVFDATALGRWDTALLTFLAGLRPRS